MADAEGSARRAARANVLISAAFVLTGIGVALLGAALPAMLAEWHLSDRDGGSLLFSAFAGTMLGALLVHHRLRQIAAVGLVSAAVATAFLSFPHRGPLQPAFLLYGVGLGITMTAISLQRSREVAPGESSLEMNRLNLLWAVGACSAPALALRSLRLVSVGGLFRSETVALLVVAAGLGFANRRKLGTDGTGSPALSPHARWAPLRMCLFACAAVGLESAIGGWLTTYTQREVHGTGVAVSANSFFWLGLLVSRAAHSLRAGRWLHSRSGVLLHLVFVTVAVAVLVAAPFESVLPVAAFLAGFGLGPLYPLVLSLALPHYRSGAVFVMAGVGASLLPWITGTVSTSFHSLRAGLAAPATTVVGLIAFAVWMRREIPVEKQITA